MTKLSLATALVLSVALSFLAGHATSQDDTTPADFQKQMEEYLKHSAPGPEHHELAKYAGDWELTMKVFPGGPGTSPMVSEGHATYESIMDGRFLMMRQKSQMMGMPYEGMGFLGYDRFKKRYHQTWIDSMGTATYPSKGYFNSETKKLTLYGEMDEPSLDVHDRLASYVYTFIDPDQFKFEIFDLHVSPDYRVIEIDFRRKK